LQESDALRATVEDDGIGVPDLFQKGLGLTGMNERVQACGGRLSVTRRASKGTIVEAIFPLAQTEELVGAT